MDRSKWIEFLGSHFLNFRKLQIFLILIHLLPIWLFDYFPTQDGPSHIYNSQVLREYWNPEYGFQAFYNINWNLFPNWLSHFALAVLMIVFSPIIAEKIFLSAYVIFFPVAILYFLNAIEYGRERISLVVFPFIYNYLLLMGFYNFAFSVPLFFFATGYWWKHKEEIHVRSIVLLNFMVIITYFSHLISYMFLLFSIGFLAITYFYKRLKLAIINVCILLPASTLLFIYLPSSDLLSGGAPKIGFSRIPELLEKFLSMDILISLGTNQSIIAYIVFAVLIYLLVHTVWQEKIIGSKKLVDRFTPIDSFLLLFLVMFGLYLILPRSVGPGGWLNDRVAILASILLLAWFREGNSRVWKSVFSLSIVLVSLVNTIYVTYQCSILNTELREFTALTQSIGKKKIVLPFFFNSKGKALRIGIFVNAANYYCLNNGGINLGNYEVQFDYFPINFRDNFQPPIDQKEWVQKVHWKADEIDICRYAEKVDYILIWGNADKNTAESLADCYQLISSRNRLKLYRGKRGNTF